ncbi:hypothetical protein GQ55_2G484200 [Panicum hallii var. hallii]|uniref:Uncharacterized protein n=1 Tax=Panicum hallii var. hallii TaxID=1504633 RepID=A0A2T7F0F3_9POAL|nr:hypothetical protein GQ55_2G484200 [Panicum hallii var. hallii]
MQPCQLEFMRVRHVGVWRGVGAAMQSAERLKLLGSFVFLPACRGIFFFDPSVAISPVQVDAMPMLLSSAAAQSNQMEINLSSGVLPAPSGTPLVEFHAPVQQTISTTSQSVYQQQLQRYYCCCCWLLDGPRSAQVHTTKAHAPTWPWAMAASSCCCCFSFRSGAQQRKKQSKRSIPFLSYLPSRACTDRSIDR